ncbi:MAG: betaine--homocysteine S-methyltransferase [Pseudomonadota bacterium]|nr:betaine--homocysteine S-methyltransferase [Pseudomonadota bacterium]
MLRQWLSERDWLLADGATGTSLQAHGLPLGEAPERWTLEQPDQVRRLHRAFVDAGADIILTNSFGGNAVRLGLAGLEGRAGEINSTAARLARDAVANAGRRVLVAGSMGPTGEMPAPWGTQDPGAARAMFAAQAQALKAGGVDLLWIETMSAGPELEAAAAAAASTGLPYVLTASFDTAGRTLAGLEPAAFAAMVRRLPVPPEAFGANCGVGAADLVLSLRQMPVADQIIVAKANCGLPTVNGASVCYAGTPALMADYARLAVDAGARIVGGCCGTTPDHLRAMHAALRDHVKGPVPGLETITGRLGPLVAPPPGLAQAG